MSPSSHTAARALIDWYRAVGVDIPVGEVPIDWLQRGDRAPGAGLDFGRVQGTTADASTSSTTAAQTHATTPAPPTPGPAEAPPPPARLVPAAAPEEAVMAARGAARTAPTLDALQSTLAGFDGCALKATAKSLCFYRGAAKSRLMLIGEAPGRDEDMEGRPFVGRAGQLLDLMLAAIGLGEADVHITNIVYWRPPGNRTPTPQEAQVCRPFLERQIELVEPEVICLLGGAAAKHILGVEDGIMRLRGKWRDVEFGGRSIKALATLHPAYLLRSPAQKRLAWRDLLMLQAALGVQA